MAVSREFIRQLSAAADLSQIVGERVSLQKRGNNMFGLCPFHTEKTPSFSVNPSKGFYHCFGCGANGDALNFIIQTEAGGDFMAGVEALAERLGMSVPRGEKDDLAGKVADIIAAAHTHFRRQLPQSTAACDYLRTRGIQPQTAERFQLGYALAGWHELSAALRGGDAKLMVQAGLLRQKDKGDNYDYFRNRLMFPIMESERRIIGFGGRALDDADEPKYLNSPDSPVFSKKRAVYGLAQAREKAREKNRVIVTEGYMDVVMLAQAGFGETVAAMGTALTTQQMQKIGRLADNIILAFDGDEAGQKAAWRSLSSILPALQDGMSAAFLFLPAGEDPDSFVQKHGVAGFDRALGESMALGDYLVKNLWKNAAGTQEGRDSAALHEGEKLIRLLNADKAPFLRELLTQRLAAAANIASAVVGQAASKEKKPLAGGKNRFRMRQGVLYNFLCCLAARPQLVEALGDNPPLPGSAAEAEITAMALNYLRRLPEDGEVPDIAGYLRAEGYAAVALQIKETVRQRYAAADKPQEELAILVQRLREEHEKCTGMARRKWLDDLRGSAG